MSSTVRPTACSPFFRPSAVPLAQRVYHLFAGVDRTNALNCTEDSSRATRDLAFELKQAINAIKLDAFDEETGAVNYRRLKTSPAYQSYRQTTRRLQTFPLRSLKTLEERLAFWINLYNILIVDAVIHFGVEATVHEVRGFFVKAAYIIDGLRFSADDIEHGILRANAGNPAIPGPQFRFHDPRFALVVSQVDPRIHFTLVCASESCPPVGIYSPEQLDQQLDLAAHNFINGGEVRVVLERNEVHLSRIFQWYAPDFGGNVLNQIGRGSFRNVLAYIARYIADDEAQQALFHHPDRFKVRFNKYDWGLNLVA